MTYALSSLPPTLKALLLITLTATVLAIAWLNLIWLINFPPSTWFCVDKRDQEYNDSKKPRSGKKARALAPRCYDVDGAGDVDQGITSATYAYTPTPSRQGFEFRHRVHIGGTGAGAGVGNEGEGSKGIELSSLRCSSQPETRIQSPGLYMRSKDKGPQLQRRSSAEWLHERAIFFSENNSSSNNNSNNNNNTTPSNPFPSPFPTSPTLTPQSLNSLSTLDMMQALEEGTVALTSQGRAATAAAKRDAKTQKNSNGVLKQSLSWLDQGLGMVDGAVDKVVDKVARWTDDEGGDEPLLLPVAWERRGIKVE